MLAHMRRGYNRAMATGTLLTIDDFERLPDEVARNHELVDGELVDVSGNTPEHRDIQEFLIVILRPLVHSQKLGKVYSELEYDFLGNAHGPDISFFGRDKLPLLNRKKRVQRFVPDLAMEIISASDTYDGMLKKKDRYLAAGTREVWLISSEAREVRICGAGQDRVLRGSDELSTPLIPGFTITADALFNLE